MLMFFPWAWRNMIHEKKPEAKKSRDSVPLKGSSHIFFSFKKPLTSNDMRDVVISAHA